MNSKRHVTLSIALLLVVGAWPGSPSAVAEEPRAAKVDALYERGREAAMAGQHEKAGEAFFAAFALDPNVSLLWNAARSFDKAGDQTRTRTLYEQYRAHPDANPEKSERARGWLEAHPRPSRPAQRSQTQVVRTIATAPQSRDSTNDVVGWTLCGLGIASAVGGTIAMALAWESRDDTYALRWDQHYAETLASHGRLASEIETREMAAWMSYGVSVALVASGITLLVTRSRSRPTRRASLPDIRVSPQDGGLHASGTWRF